MKKLYLLLALIAACGETTPTSPQQLILNRPRDMAFGCYGGLRITGGGSATVDQDIQFSAQPMESCDDRAHTTPITPTGQEDLTMAGGPVLPPVDYVGFVLEPNLSSVALWTWAAKPPTQFVGGTTPNGDIAPIDADPLTPGVNPITVGDDPVAIATDSIGCKVVTANEGSCDLSVLDVTSAIQLAAHVDRLVVKNSTGTEIRAKPFAMVGQPPTGVIGNACPANATGVAYIAYPSCHMVAAVELASGSIVDSIVFDAMGTATLGGSAVTCPDECGGVATTPGTRPVALDLEFDPRTQTRRLAIGADNSNRITVVDLNATNTPTAVSQITLEDPGSLGITAVSMTPVIGMGGDTGTLDDNTATQMQFVYGVATDRSVRVAEVLNVNKECDAQVDPRYLWDVRDVAKLSCLPVGDPATPPRRAGAHSPGIELIGDAVPVSVATYHVDTYDADTRSFGPGRLIGYFGAISAENGYAFLFNIDDDSQADFVNPPSDPMDPLGTQIPLDIAHQLRDSLPDRGRTAVSMDGTGAPVCDDRGPDPDNGANNAGGARAPDPPVRNVPGLYVSGPKVGELPYIRALACSAADDTRPVSELEWAAPVPERLNEFPDLRGLRGDEEWTLTYQGTLSLDTVAPPAIDGPIARTGQLAIDNTTQMRLADPTRPFCDAGVEPYDIVQLRGCDPASPSDCPIGYSCYVHPQSQIANLGSCMLAGEAERLANACKPFLTSLRRYTVQKTTSGELVLMPRKHILRTTPIDGCVSDNQCQALANFAVQNASTTNPIDTSIMDTHHWQCAVDAALQPELDPQGQPMKRCIQTCTMDSDCSIGTVCDGGYCMEGVIPPQACVNAPEKFELRGSEAFVVIGSRTGYVHPIIADASGNCARDPNANPLQIGRIPLRAPACDPTADPRTGVNPSGVREPNPCETTVMHTETVPNYTSGTCTVGSPATTMITRTATAIKFRNRGLTLTMVDPTYPGDMTCINDRMGNLGNVPMTADGYQIAFRQAGGFFPTSLPFTASLPVKIVKQPRAAVTDPMRDSGFGDPIWVIDEGDYISTSITSASTLGKVFRVETQAPGVVNTLE